MPVSEFLENYWQKKPCLLRQAFPDFKAGFDRESLLALACDESVESRLVLERDGDYPWQVLSGPFDQAELNELPSRHWSLLLQNAELHLPSAYRVLNQFNFIPNWRIDDLMISYACDAGSVGPHLDSYDVFLLQAAGKREWTINANDFDENDFIDGLDLRIIENFRAEEKYVLETGDMLYLPPGIAHHGIALGESITCSIGFRAPSSHELLTSYVDDVLERSEDKRYSDPGLMQRQHPGEITQVELADIESLFRATLPDSSSLATWIGRYLSLPSGSFIDLQTVSPVNRTEMMRDLKTSRQLLKAASVRSVFFRNDDGLLLFVNGDKYFLPQEYSHFAHDFSSNQVIDNPLHDVDSPPSVMAAVIQDLYMRGLLSTNKNQKT